MLKGNIYFFAKENLFSESEETVYVHIVGDPIFDIFIMYHVNKMVSTLDMSSVMRNILCF